MSAFYNDNDPFVCDWLENLIRAGHIAPGTVSGKSIADLVGRELVGAHQAHFFAGIGVWSAALRAAGWPDDRPIWTGSCPCQPFSGAGKGDRFADERHLWPAWFWLISQHQPDVIFGEQVEGPAGRAWLDLVFTDLEGIGYACGAVVFPAAGVGAPHIRSRTYWVAHANQGRQQKLWAGDDLTRRQPRPIFQPARDSATGGLADAQGARVRNNGCRGRDAGGMGVSDGAGSQPWWFAAEAARHGHPAIAASCGDRPGPVNGLWRDADWLFCRDGYWRPVEPESFPLAHGAPARVGRLRAYGNALVLQQAQAFIESFMEIEG
jgi:DNA (cytosine-5)-methyltransferase 1